MSEQTRTYWEKRCNINENVMDAMLQIMENILPPAGLEAANDLRKEWQNALDNLENHCEHEWVNADNEVVTGAEICTRCFTIRASST